jgi:hypothetical protein
VKVSREIVERGIPVRADNSKLLSPSSAGRNALSMFNPLANVLANLLSPFRSLIELFDFCSRVETQELKDTCALDIAAVDKLINPV